MNSIKEYKQIKKKNNQTINLKKQYSTMLQAHNKAVMENFRNVSKGRAEVRGGGSVQGGGLGAS